MKIKALFVGSFLSKYRGTKGISEHLKELFESSNEISIRLVSKHKNKILRLLDIVVACFFSNYQTTHIDIFSDQAFYIARTASWIAKIRGKKIIMTLHGGKLPDYHIRNSDIFNKTLNRADSIQTPSRYLQQYFQNIGLKVEYLPNSITQKNFPFSLSEVKEPSLLWVRAFSPIYNPDLTVKILHEVRKTHPHATLTMIGPDKGELQHVKELINRLGLQDVVFIIGPVPNEQLFRYFHSHSVYLNTTSYESFGVAVMEAAACGIPIVSTKVGEIPYLWTDEEEILMVSGFEPEHFAKQVLRLFKNKDLALKLSINAHKKAEMFDWSRIKSRWIELLK